LRQSAQLGEKMTRIASSQRRFLLANIAALIGCQPRSGASVLNSYPANVVESDEALQYKFRGLRGGQLIVDGMVEKYGVNIFDEQGKVFYQSGTVSIRNRSRQSYSANFGVPKTLRAEWRDPAGGVTCCNERTGAYEGGRIIANYTVPIASRIPDEVLDAVRSKKGGFRLKLRLHDDGLLIGWDIETGFRKYELAGGDFREAEIEDGKAVRKGWYIDPKTKQRIETDY
jgi:hypothetical protein